MDKGVSVTICNSSGKVKQFIEWGFSDFYLLFCGVLARPQGPPCKRDFLLSQLK